MSSHGLHKCRLVSTPCILNPRHGLHQACLEAAPAMCVCVSVGGAGGGSLSQAVASGALHSIQDGFATMLRLSQRGSGRDPAAAAELISTLTLPDATTAASLYTQQSMATQSAVAALNSALSKQAEAAESQGGSALYSQSDNEEGDDLFESEEVGGEGAPRATIHGNPMYFGTNSELAAAAGSDLLTAVTAAASLAAADGTDADMMAVACSSSNTPDAEAVQMVSRDVLSAKQAHERSTAGSDWASAAVAARSPRKGKRTALRSKSARDSTAVMRPSERAALFDTLTMPRNFLLTSEIERMAAEGAAAAQDRQRESSSGSGAHSTAPSAAAPLPPHSAGDSDKADQSDANSSAKDAQADESDHGGEDGSGGEDEGSAAPAYFRSKAATTVHGNPMYFGSELSDVGADAFALPAKSLASGKSAVEMVSLASLVPAISAARSGTPLATAATGGVATGVPRAESMDAPEDTAEAAATPTLTVLWLPAVRQWTSLQPSRRQMLNMPARL